jgi:predicted DCC family thiol-disulfide oxidoreductase YuxK
MLTRPYHVFYDGRCRLCRRGRQSIERLRPLEPVRFVDVHDAAEVARHPQMAGRDTLGQMYVIDPAGRVSGGYDALAALAPILPAFAWLAPVLGFAPVRWAGRRVYKWVAANRYRLGGQASCHDGACALPPPPPAVVAGRG